MANRSIIFLLTIILLSQKVKAQETFGYYAGVSATTTILSSGLIGGVGAAIHKKPGQRLLRTFGNGFLKGMAAGAMCWTGKYVMGNIAVEKEYGYAWEGRVFNAVGCSMLNNATMNRGLFDEMSLNLGMIHLDLNTRTMRFRARPMPMATIGTALLIAAGDKFDLSRTLATGTINFTNDRRKNTTNFGIITTCPDVNNSFPRNLVNTYTEKSEYASVAHEIIHTFQYDNLMSMNYWVYKNESRWFYLDVSTFSPIYEARATYQDDHKKGYHWTYFEMEAELLSKWNSDYLEISQPGILKRK